MHAVSLRLGIEDLTVQSVARDEVQAEHSASKANYVQPLRRKFCPHGLCLLAAGQRLIHLYVPPFVYGGTFEMASVLQSFIATNGPVPRDSATAESLMIGASELDGSFSKRSSAIRKPSASTASRTLPRSESAVEGT